MLEILYKFTPKGETYSLIFFMDGDNIFKTKINTSNLNKLSESGEDNLQGYLRKRYNYNRDSVDRIDSIEIKSLYKHFISIKADVESAKVYQVMRNRKIDELLN